MENSLSLLTPDWPAPARVRACITTRMGGNSNGNYKTNNLALHVGDDAEIVEANRLALVQQLSLKRNPQWLEQVHGIKVARARDDKLVRTADAAYTTETGLACVVMTADCLPILLCDRDGTQVAAVHAGWRGLAKGVVARAVQQFAIPAGQLLAYLGPAISQPHFEVGVEVLEAFFKSARDPRHSERVADAFKPGLRPLHFHADIFALARAELQALGVHAIYGGGLCTFSDQDNFYSYRRDRDTGRMASLIWLLN